MRIILPEQRSGKGEKNAPYQSCVFLHSIRQGKHMKYLNFDLNLKEHLLLWGSRVQHREHLSTPTTLNMVLLSKSTRRILLLKP